MAGEIPLKVDQYPDDFRIHVVTISPGGNAAAQFPLLVLDRDSVIDNVSVKWNTAETVDSGSAAAQALDKVTLVSVGSGTAFSTLSASQSEDTHVATTGISTVSVAAGTLSTFTILSSANKLSAGATLIAKFGQRQNQLANATFVIRYRSRLR